MSDPFWQFPYPSQRMPVLADNVVSTSQPLASAAGLLMLARGGNAVDAALATAIALAVVEPCMNGIGGDMFAIVWHKGEMFGLNASGRAPSAWDTARFAGRESMDRIGWGSVTVPGTISGWRAIWEKFGSLPFADLFEPAIRYAHDGYLVSPTVHRQWQPQVERLGGQPGFLDAFAPRGRAPLAGERFICPGQAATLESIARSKGESFYRGELAAAIARHARNTGGLITEVDLAADTADWVQPISTAYRDLELHEIGPNGQGIGALMALGMLRHFDLQESGLDSARTLHLQIEAMRLAFADLDAHVGDAAHMQMSAEQLLDADYLKARARLIDPARAGTPGPGKLHSGGTVYLTAADRQGTMVSFIQSNFKGFGSGVVVPGTGIALHNRGRGFSTQPGHPNVVAPGKRPFHTIIPGFVTKDGQPFMTLGVMGGSMQAQGHVQILSRMADFGQNPQAASDAPRWRVQDDNVGVAVEWNCPPDAVAQLRAMGHDISISPRFDTEFGCAQMAMRLPDGYLAASDHRKDGYAVGF
jgi:gamma-glutamyltranspeptidase/glutathione hydrolase